MINGIRKGEIGLGQVRN